MGPEGLSDALIAAMGYGLPCVMIGVSGNTEALAEGPTGIWSPAKMSKSWPTGCCACCEIPSAAGRWAAPPATP